MVADLVGEVVVGLEGELVSMFAMSFNFLGVVHSHRSSLYQKQTPRQFCQRSSVVSTWGASCSFHSQEEHSLILCWNNFLLDELMTDIIFSGARIEECSTLKAIEWTCQFGFAA